MKLIHFSKQNELNFDADYINNMDENGTYFYKDLTDEQISKLEIGWSDKYCHLFFLDDKYESIVEDVQSFDANETGLGFGYTEYFIKAEHLLKLEKW